MLKIVCPMCGKKSKVEIPVMAPPEGKMLTTISIPRGYMCDHCFQFFVDANFMIRGYQKVDIELQVPANITPSGSGSRATVQLDDIIEILGIVITIYLFRALMIGFPVYMMNLDETTFDAMKTFFGEILGGDLPSFTLVGASSGEDVAPVGSGVREVGSDTAFVFDARSRIVNALPFYDKDYPEELGAIEKAITMDTASAQVRVLRDRWKSVLELVDVTLVLIEEQGTLPFKKLRKIISSKFKFKVSKDLLVLVLDIVEYKHGIHVYDKPVPFKERIKSLLDDF
ncbi:MAG: hypothetical protein ACTSU5_02715 [Promethearchaeota archaeon]